MGIFAASTGLAAPLPPVYVTAADAVSFSLFRGTQWPFNDVNFVGSANSPPSANRTVPFSNAALVAAPPGAQWNLSLKAAAGRKLLSLQNSAVTDLLYGSPRSDSQKRLERAAGFGRVGGVGVPASGTPLGRRRSLLQAAPNATGDGSLTVNVTVLADAVPGNASLTELPGDMYQTLLTDASAAYNFLTGNLPDESNKA